MPKIMSKPMPSAFTMLIGIKRHGPLPHWPHPEPKVENCYWFRWFMLSELIRHQSHEQPYMLHRCPLPGSHSLDDHVHFAWQLYDYFKYFEGHLDFQLAIEPHTENPKIRYFSRCIQRQVRRTVLVDRGMGGECSICLQQFKLPLVRLAGCTHRFHTRCIKKWLEMRRSCPMCRREVESEWETVYEFIYYKTDSVSTSSG